MLKLLVIFGCLLLPILLVVATLFFGQHSMIYHPSPYASNYRHLLPGNAVELQFKTDASRQTAFYLPNKNGSHLPDRVWVAFSGNGSLALAWVTIAAADHLPGDAFLLIDYPGYGRSEGYATIASTRAAAEGALIALADRLQVNETVLEPRLDTIGHSLGAAAALDFATRHPVQRVVLLAPFTSLRDEAAYVVGRWLSYLVRENYDNRAALHLLAGRHPTPRVTIFHGADDTLIPARMGQELAAEFPSFVTFHLVPNANHDDVALAAEAGILASIQSN